VQNVVFFVKKSSIFLLPCRSSTSRPICGPTPSVPVLRSHHSCWAPVSRQLLGSRLTTAAGLPPHDSWCSLTTAVGCGLLSTSAGIPTLNLKQSKRGHLSRRLEKEDDIPPLPAGTTLQVGSRCSIINGTPMWGWFRQSSPPSWMTSQLHGRETADNQLNRVEKQWRYLVKWNGGRRLGKKTKQPIWRLIGKQLKCVLL
jgi:hypothetical protein